MVDWWADVSFDDKDLFVAAHMLGVSGIMSGFEDMTLRPNDFLTDQERRDIQSKVGSVLDWPSGELSRGQAAMWLIRALAL